MTAWVLEPDVFTQASFEAMRDAVRVAGDEVVAWDDDWWSTGRWHSLVDRRVVFHGSLGNAARIAAELQWKPGAFCATSAFACSSYYPGLGPSLAQRSWLLTTVAAFVADPRGVTVGLGHVEAVFVRPDSALKPFSGRVVAVDEVSPKALDYGIYYDDDALPIVIAPVVNIGREWRYVVVDGAIVAGSAYDAVGREAIPSGAHEASWCFAADVAARISAPEPVYVLDVCEREGELKVLELNPFSGADLYACDRRAVVVAVTAFLR